MLMILLLQTFSLWLFQSGFLLTRHALVEHSPPTSWPSLPLDMSHHSNTSKRAAPFKKLIWLVVDALRFDFVAPVPGSELPYHNRLQSIQNRLHHGVLFHFIADPPTTTLQRLQALTTGSLPTFIDVRQNFKGGVEDARAEGALDTFFQEQEDSWLWQAVHAQQRIVVIGDDTWTGIFPQSMFQRTHVFPSLNVMDVDGVDEACLGHLWSYLSNKTRTTEKDSEWDVLIVHLLGVDHCGHRYGPNHALMKRKLEDMDRVLERLFQEVEEGTLLLVMGDHGMDSKGDHGGDSWSEVDAALFAFSPGHDFHAASFLTLTDQLSQQLEALGLEMKAPLSADATTTQQDPILAYPIVRQIDLVPTVSVLMGWPIPFGNLGALIPQLSLDKRCLTQRCRAQLLHDAMLQNVQQMHRYLERYLSDSDKHSLSEKDVLELEHLYLRAVSHQKVNNVSSVEDHLKKSVDCLLFMRTTLDHFRRSWAQFQLSSMLVGIGLLLLSLPLFLILSVHRQPGRRSESILIRLRSSFSSSLLPLLTVEALLVGLHAAIMASNSYIVHEDKVVFYLAQALTLLLLLYQSPSETADARGLFHPLVLLFLNRMVFSSKLCREEQGPHCQTTFYGSPPFLFDFFDSTETTTSSSGSSMFNAASLLLLLVTALGLPLLGRRFLLSCGITSPKTARRLAWTVQGHLCLALTYWSLEFMESLSHVSSQTTTDSITGWLLFQQIKLYTARACFTLPLLVALSIGRAPSHERMIRLWIALFLAVATVQQPTGIWIMSLGLWQLGCWLTNGPKVSVKWTGLGISLLAYQQFYATGHQATFSSIPFQTGFIGLDGFHPLWSGVLVSANVIGPTLVFAVGSLLSRSSGVEAALKRTPVWRETVWMLLLHRTLVTFSSTVFVAHLRRHLMVWKIFAPRFMLAAVDLVLVQGCLFLCSLLLPATSDSVASVDILTANKKKKEKKK